MSSGGTPWSAAPWVGPRGGVGFACMGGRRGELLDCQREVCRGCIRLDGGALVGERFRLSAGDGASRSGT